MSRQRDEEIRKAIREMMQDNVIRLVIGGEGESQERYHQNQRIFLHLEIRDTSPAIRYLYDLSHTVYIGRSETENQICIRDRMVSRYQGRIWSENGYAYYADEEDAGNPAVIRRSIWTTRLQSGERIRLQTKDCLIIGRVKMKIRLFMGEQELFG